MTIYQLIFGQSLVYEFHTTETLGITFAKENHRNHLQSDGLFHPSSTQIMKKNHISGSFSPKYSAKNQLGIPNVSKGVSRSKYKLLL